MQRWVINTLAVMVAANVVPGIRAEGWMSLLVASLLLGILNAILRPLLFLLSLPVVVLTLGLFSLVINAFMLFIVGKIVAPFHVDGFWAAFWGAVVISLVTLVLNTLTRTGESRIDLRTPGRRSRSRRGPGDEDSGGGSGPVIDV